MDTRYIKTIMQRPSCLIMIIIATFLTGSVVALTGYSLLAANQPEVEPTLDAEGCYIELTVTHDLYDEREDYYSEGLSIGELEAGIYGVIGQSDNLYAVDWRGDINVHPPTLELIDWVHPIDGMNFLDGECDNVTYFASIAPDLTVTP